MKPEYFNAAKIPAGRARISHAVAFGNLVFVSGMVGRTPKTGKIVEGGIAEQTRQALENIRSALEAAGSSLDYVLKTDCHLLDMRDFNAFNEVWESYFRKVPPARICTQAGALGPDFLVEIDAVAGRPNRGSLDEQP